MTSEITYETDQIQKHLVGWRIIRPIEDQGYFGFLVAKGKKEKAVWVDRDPEGNGPGHLTIDELGLPTN
jgi:hypothetical protein